MKQLRLGNLALLAVGAVSAGSSCAADDPRLEESRALVRTFGANLQRELKKGLADGGPVGAISVCKDKAPQIASELSRYSGAKVRRTSLRFRNPANAPEPWEARVLKDFERQAGATEPTSPLEYFVREDDGTVRYLSAIRTAGVCLACHGATLSPELTAQLDVDYPHDHARGYALGDVRGAFSLTWPPPYDPPSR